MKRILLILALFALIGCHTTPKVDEPTHNNSLASSSHVIDQNSASINTSVDNISKANDAIIAKTTDAGKFLSDAFGKKEINQPTFETLNDTVNSILARTSIVTNETANVKTSLEKIKAEQINLSKAQTDIKNLESTIVKLREENVKAKNEAIKDLYSNLKFIFAIGSLCIVGGAVLFFLVDKKLGAAIVGIGFLTIGLAAGAVYYMKWLAIFGIIIILSGLALAAGLLTLYLIKFSKEVDKKDAAVVENVQLIEEIKKHLPEESKVAIFGAQQGIAAKIQSDTTKEIVSDIRTDIQGQK